MKISLGIVDDHQLFLKSLSLMLATFDDYTVVVEALNGKDLQLKMQKKLLPKIMLIDVNMPVMDGVDTAKWLHKNHPSIKLVALSMNDSDRSVIAMIKAGCCAYLLKDTHPNELEKALHEIYTKGYYNSESGSVDYRRLLASANDSDLFISEKEKEFLQFSATDMTYKEVAVEMNMSIRTVDGYRENLFKKFNVQSRTGLVLEAIRRDLIKL